MSAENDPENLNSLSEETSKRMRELARKVLDSDYDLMPFNDRLPILKAEVVYAPILEAQETIE